MSKTCAGCGAPLGDDDRFCRICGKAAALSAPGEEDAVPVFVIKQGTACLDGDEPAAVPPDQAENQSAAAPRSARSVQASAPHLSRREHRIARKLARVEAEEEDHAADAQPEPVPVKKSRWKARLVSLLIAVLLIGALVGGLYARQKIEAYAFVPVQTAYTAFSSHSPEKLKEAFAPELYEAMTDLGYLESSGEWERQRDLWRNVYGRDFAVEPVLRGGTWIRGAERDQYLAALNTEYSAVFSPRILLRLDYTVKVTARDADASIRKTAYVGLMDGRWYLLQNTF